MSVINIGRPTTLTGKSAASTTESFVMPASDIVAVDPFTDGEFSVMVGAFNHDDFSSGSIELWTSPYPQPGGPGERRLGFVSLSDPTRSTTSFITVRSQDTGVFPLQRYLYWKVLITSGATGGWWTISFQIVGDLRVG